MAQEISNAYYYVPQDKDDPEVPNAFCIPLKQEDIKLNHIKKYFPLAGEYIFRFKYKYNNQIVWMDIPENSKKLPIHEGRIFLKATRISWESKILPQQVQSQAQEPQKTIVSPSLSSSVVLQQQSQTQGKPKTYDLFEDEPSSNIPPQRNNQSTSNGNTTDLLDF